MRQCLLCLQTITVQDFYQNENSHIFCRCNGCGLFFRSPENRLSLQAERARYELHQNNVTDLDYQNFLRPIVEAILKNHTPEQQGMDFGCGPSSVISHLLKKQSYQIVDYDPFFFPLEHLLLNQYDYVTCTEVVEHFFNPDQEFKKLRLLLKPEGQLYIKTSLTDQVQDFTQWYYQRDPSHVSFYNIKSLRYIKTKFEFSHLEVFEKYIVFKA